MSKINGVDQMQGREYKAENTTFTADEKKSIFLTNIAGGYPEEAEVEKWIRTYRLDHGKKFTVSDNFKLSEVKDKRINIRLTNRDLTEIKRKAVNEGLPYRTLVSGILHKYVNGRLIEKSE